MRLPLAVVVLLLAGCSSPATPTMEPEAQVSSTAATTVLSNGLPGPYTASFWGNGTVPVQDTCMTGACINDVERAYHRIALDAVPVGVPLHLALDVQYDPHDVLADNNEAWFEVEDGTYYAYSATFEPGALHVEALVAVTSGLRAVFGAAAPGGGSTETPFTMVVHVQAHAQDIPAGVPVAIAGNVGDSLSIPGPFLLFDPEDRPLGRFEDTVQLERKGEYLVLLPPGSAPANVSTTGAAKTWRAVGLAFAAGDPVHLPFSGSVDAPWQVTGAPLGIGLLVRLVNGPAGPSLASIGFAVDISDAQGILLESGPQCGGCLTFGEYGYIMTTPLGDPRIVAGDYLIHGETNFTADIEFVPFSLHAQR